MKTSISRIALFAIIVAGSPLVQADNEDFPNPGRTYDVMFAETAQLSKGQIKIIRKGEGTWVFVESTAQVTGRPKRPVVPGGQQPAPKEPKTTPKKLWINTQWIVSASESEAEKK